MATAVVDRASERRLRDLGQRLGRCTGDASKTSFAAQVPLRICPLGAHVDHQGGRVTGMTVDRSVRVAAVASDRKRVVAESTCFPGIVKLELAAPTASASGCWGDYLQAAVSVLGERHQLDRGFRAVVDGDLPGCGLSSSAAVLIAYFMVLAEINEIDLATDELIELVQRAENEHVGVASGRLDPSVILHAEAGSLTHIDCSNGAVRQNRRGTGGGPPAVIVAFSGQSRSLAASGFNDRVTECRDAARRLLRLAGLASHDGSRLADVPRPVFDGLGHRLPPVLRRRADHYFGEIERVEAGEVAWRRGDLAAFGALVNASGESSIVNYESGTAELVALFELLRMSEGVFGSRFSGAGFGGSCIALADPDASNEVVEAVAARYAELHSEAAAAAAFSVCRSAGPPQLLRMEA